MSTRAMATRSSFRAAARAVPRTVRPAVSAKAQLASFTRVQAPRFSAPNSIRIVSCDAKKSVGDLSAGDLEV